MLGLAPSFWRLRGGNLASLELDGATQLASYLGDPADFNIAGDKLTLMQWVNQAQLGGTQVFQAQVGAYAMYFVDGIDDQLRVRLTNGAGLDDFVQWEIAPPLDTWVHYAFVWDGALTVATGSMKLYINAVDQGAPVELTVNNIVALEASMAPYSVGGWDLGGGPAGFLNGKLDETRIYQAALTQPEIAADYNLEIDPATAGLYHYFRYNGNLDDLVAGDNLAGTGGPTFSPDTPFP